MAEQAGAVDASDAVLVEASQRGDVQQFATLFERHVDVVRMVVRDNVRDADDHADCVQEVFARALENLGRLDDPERFRPWLLAIARHVAIDGRRKRVKDVERYSDAVADELPTRARTPSIEVELRSLGGRVRNALGALPEREATAVALATYLDLNPAEIGAALGVKPGNAKVIVHRARRRLRNALTLEMLRAGEGCDEFRAFDPADIDDIGEHVAGCERCQRRAQSLLQVDHR